MKEGITIEKAKEDYNPRKAFQIMINDKPYQIWSIDGLEHENGKWNGTPTTWWLEYSDAEKERELIPFVDKMVHRVCWGIDYKQFNTSKYKWDEWSISSRGACTISANGKEVYKFHSHDLGYALAKAQTTIVIISEHPYNFINPSEEKGRKIWYYGIPATIEPSDYHPGEISICPDYSTGIDENQWWKLYKERSQNVQPPKDIDDNLQMAELDNEQMEETRSYGKINHGDALWDGMINWFRQ